MKGSGMERLTFGGADEDFGGQTVADFVVGSQFHAVERRRFQFFQIQFHRGRVVDVDRDLDSIADDAIPRVVTHLPIPRKHVLLVVSAPRRQ